MVRESQEYDPFDLDSGEIFRSPHYVPEPAPTPARLFLALIVALALALCVAIAVSDLASILTH